MEQVLFEGVVALFFFGLPLALTVYNILSLIPKLREKNFFTENRRRLGAVTLVLGAVFSWIYIVTFCGERNWDKPVILGAGNAQWHSPVSLDYAFSFMLPMTLAFVSLLILLCGKKRRPPLISAGLISMSFVGAVLQGILTVQLFRSDTPLLDLPIAVYVLNYLLILARTMRHEIKAQLEYLAHNGSEDNSSRVMRSIYSWLNSSVRWVVFCFVLMLPLLVVLTVILIIFGQGADGMIKSFTETADWNFSQKTPPPPEYYKGHYLCTVAAGGHRGLVKPTRYGIRRGERIIVNRQLCIANAFEELIQERTPRLHKRVRSFYDTYGYPIAEKITTPFKADIVYILMKPLEWIFLLALYTFDTEPERRIALQYTNR